MRFSARILIICMFIYTSFQNPLMAESEMLADLNNMFKVLDGKAQRDNEERALLEDDATRGKVQAQADLAYLLYKEGKVLFFKL